MITPLKDVFNVFTSFIGRKPKGLHQHLLASDEQTGKVIFNIIQLTFDTSSQCLPCKMAPFAQGELNSTFFCMGTILAPIFISLVYNI